MKKALIILGAIAAAGVAAWVLLKPKAAAAATDKPNSTGSKPQDTPVSDTPSYSADFTTSVSNLTVVCSSSANPSGTQFRWSFGDGKSSTDANPTHIYAKDGTYTISLKVIYNGLHKGSSSKTVDVSSPVNSYEGKFIVANKGHETVSGYASPFFVKKGKRYSVTTDQFKTLNGLGDNDKWITQDSNGNWSGYYIPVTASDISSIPMGGALTDTIYSSFAPDDLNFAPNDLNTDGKRNTFGRVNIAENAMNDLSFSPNDLNYCGLDGKRMRYGRVDIAENSMNDLS